MQLLTPKTSSHLVGHELEHVLFTCLLLLSSNEQLVENVVGLLESEAQIISIECRWAEDEMERKKRK